MTKSRVLLLVLFVALVAAAGGFAGGWFVRDSRSGSEREQSGVFSLSSAEEKKIPFTVPFAAVPTMLVEESTGAVTVTDVQPSYFKVKCKFGVIVNNKPWKARGVLAE